MRSVVNKPQRHEGHREKVEYFFVFFVSLWFVFWIGCRCVSAGQGLPQLAADLKEARQYVEAQQFEKARVILQKSEIGRSHALRLYASIGSSRIDVEESRFWTAWE